MARHNTIKYELHQIIDEVRRLVRAQLGWHDDHEISDDLSKEDAGFDSIDEIELIMMIEDRFEIEMHDNEIEKLSTINDIVKYLEDRLKP